MQVRSHTETIRQVSDAARVENPSTWHLNEAHDLTARGLPVRNLDVNHFERPVHEGFTVADTVNALLNLRRNDARYSDRNSAPAPKWLPNDILRATVSQPEVAPNIPQPAAAPDNARSTRFGRSLGAGVRRHNPGGFLGLFARRPTAPKPGRHTRQH